MSFRDTFYDYTAGDQSGLLNSNSATSPAAPPVASGTSCLSDTLDLIKGASGIIIHASGVLKVLTAGGTTVTLPALAVGVVHPLRIKRVFNTTTTVTAANITLLFPRY